jgi:hypothetical protein
MGNTVSLPLIMKWFRILERKPNYIKLVTVLYNDKHAAIITIRYASDRGVETKGRCYSFSGTRRIGCTFMPSISPRANRNRSLMVGGRSISGIETNPNVP